MLSQTASQLETGSDSEEYLHEFKNKNTIRFAVGTPENPQSWIWRLWVQGDEVYLGTKMHSMCLKLAYINQASGELHLLKN